MPPADFGAQAGGQNTDMTTQQQTDIQQRIDALAAATARLTAVVDTAAAAGPDAFRAPSLLPDWSIGHVVTHLGRNADGMTGVLRAAQDGRQVPMYASPQARETDIEAGAVRNTATIAADFRSATGTLAKTIESLPEADWSATVDLGRGGPTTAEVVLSARLAEIEVHHHDLGVDAGLALLDDDQAAVLMAALLRSYVRTRDVTGFVLQPDGGVPIVIGDGGPMVWGRPVDLVGWLSGRADGSSLRPDGPLPELPAW